MVKKVGFRYKGKKVNVSPVEKVSGFGKFRGLMFRRRKNAKALLFDFVRSVRQPIHSFFVFFPFVAVWLDSKNKVVQIRKVNPFNPYVAPKKHFKKLLEIPINEKYSDILGFLVDN